MNERVRAPSSEVRYVPIPAFDSLMRLGGEPGREGINEAGRVGPMDGNAVRGGPIDPAIEGEFVDGEVRDAGWRGPLVDVQFGIARVRKAEELGVGRIFGRASGRVVVSLVMI
jgi:hypothetical protein